MPEQFFQPIGLPGSLQRTFKPSPTFRAGYKNIYGTNVEGNYEPETNTGSIDVNFPIGSHQSGVGLNATGYIKPGINGISDYGGFIGISKKITPQVGNQQVIRAIAQETGIKPEDLNAYQNTSYRNNNNDDEFAKQFAKRFLETKRRLIDERMGITPGAEKYSLGFGADVKNIPMQLSGSNLTEMYEMPMQFNQPPSGYPVRSNEFPSNYDQYETHQLKDISNQNTLPIYGMNR